MYAAFVYLASLYITQYFFKCAHHTEKPIDGLTGCVAMHVHGLHSANATLAVRHGMHDA